MVGSPALRPVTPWAQSVSGKNRSNVPRAPKPDVGRVLESLDKRLSNVEQILPTLATKDEMHSAIAAATAPLATRDEVKAEGRETRRHIDVVAESLRTEIRSIAEARRSR